MAYNPLKPANDDFLASFPPEMREQLRAIIEDQIVDAMKVKGMSPGNATGNIPVSNGTVNTNLNADKLDGQDATAFATSGHVHSAATTSTNGFMSNTDKSKLDGIAAGAEVNQNAFGNVVVGGTTIVADAKTDSLELVAGSKITLTPDATNDRVTIAFSGVADSDVSAAVNGVLPVGTVRSQLSALDVTQATAKTTLADADVIGLNDSAASNVKKKITWANLKSTLFGTPAGNGYLLSSTTAGVRSWVVGVLATVLTGLSTATATAVAATDTILVAIGKLQAQVTARLPLAGGQMTGALNEATGTAIASASTINLTTATGNLVHITGTTTITAVTLGSGMRRTVIFDGILTLTHHATANNLPGAANITTAAGDRAIYTSDGTTVYCISYQRASGAAVGGGGGAAAGLGDYLVDAATVTAGTGLQINEPAYRAIISETEVNKIAENAITIPARTAFLRYLTKAGVKGNIVAAYTAADIVDANTIAFWSIAAWDGTSAIANGAVGVNGNTVAVANALTKTGTVTRVDGRVGYAAKGDGSTGYFVSANSTGFPTGNAARTLHALWTCRSAAESGRILGLGINVGSMFMALNVSGQLCYNDGNSNNPTGFYFDIGRTYLVSMTHTGSELAIWVDGAKVWAAASAVNTAAAAVWVCAGTNGEVHFYQIKNAVDTIAQIATLAQKLLIPCAYGSTDIRSVLPADSIATSYIETSSTVPIKIVDASAPKGATPDWAYGVRVGPNGCLNRIKKLGKQSFSGTTSKKWDNPFGSRNIVMRGTWSLDAAGTLESQIPEDAANSYLSVDTSGKIVQTVTTGVNVAGSNKTTGYLDVIAEVLD